MRINYFDAETRSIITLTPPNPEYLMTDWVINRVSVLAPHRGKGLARKLMAEVLFDADTEGVVIQLVAAPDGSDTGLTLQQLENWYQRLGFEVVDPEYTLMMRLPKVRTSLHYV